MKHNRVVVTGGAGFVGSHLVEHLLQNDNAVTVVDNRKNKSWVPEEATVIDQDVQQKNAVDDILTPDIDAVFHLAASKAVNTETPREQFEANTTMMYNVLNAMRHNGIETLVYTSSSTVYGEAPRPTSEDYAPLEPISVYGSSKLANESLCSAYSHSHDIQAYIFRFANIVGPRLRGAVIPDFIQKLQQNPEKLEILGDGRQEKSYMHISDCINAVMTVINQTNDQINTYNLGTQTTTSVDQIADIVSDELGCDPTYEYTGGDRGWTGDVPRMQLSIEKLTTLDWVPEFESDEAVRKATKELIREI